MWNLTSYHPINDGCIPCTLRIGVTGHRKLDDRASVITAVREALTRLNELLAPSSRTVIVPVVVSALAEGADRLVAQEVLTGEGARLEVVLPLAPADYLEDFATAYSKREFLDLLSRASSMRQIPPAASRAEAYEQAGRRVVDRSDVVIALWDGQAPRGRGGTASIVAYTRKQGVPLIWVHTTGKPLVVLDFASRRAALLQDSIHKLDEYNASVIRVPHFEVRSRVQRERFTPKGCADLLRPACEQAADWLIPYFVRADIRSSRLQSWFWVLSAAIFAMAAAAVVVVAVQTSFLTAQGWVVAFEVILLLCLLGVQLINRRWRLHDRWISYRYLTERLRSSYFLTLIGTGDRRERPPRLQYFSDSSADWIRRALREVMARRPEIDPVSFDVKSLRDYLNQHWIDNQISYHNKMAASQWRIDKWLLRTTELLFGVTVVAAVLHALGIGELAGPNSHLVALLIVLSISVPAIGAAVHGIATQRQDRRHAQRNSRMVGLLTQLREDMSNASSLRQVQELAVETERIMREENSDWFGVVRFHDMELIT